MVFLGILLEFLKMLSFPYVFESKSSKTIQKPCVFGHQTFEKYDSTTENEDQNAQLR